MTRRSQYQAAFKSRVALEALKETKTIAEVAQEFKIHTTQIAKWKAQAAQGLSQLFEDKRKRKSAPEVDIEALYAQIGKLQSQLEFLKKKPAWTTPEKRMLIEPNYPQLSVNDQCEALGLARSSYYYAPIEEKEETLLLMKRIEELHYEQPEYGYRKIHADLRREGFKVNEKKIERLWRQVGYRSLLPRKKLSKPSSLDQQYPYLLNGLWVCRPNQVFSTDITFLPMLRGFIYLVTVTDWFSRYVLSRELSNSLSVDFCITALEKPLEIACPEYFNTDQGSQFTSTTFIEKLKGKGIQISMDGKGRCIDNVYQERGWWSLKYEKLYLHPYETVKELYTGVEEYFKHFNERRPHQALLYATPHEIYHGLKPKYSQGEYRGFEVKKAKC